MLFPYTPSGQRPASGYRHVLWLHSQGGIYKPLSFKAEQTRLPAAGTQQQTTPYTIRGHNKSSSREEYYSHLPAATGQKGQRSSQADAFQMGSDSTTSLTGEKSKFLFCTQVLWNPNQYKCEWAWYPESAPSLGTWHGVQNVSVMSKWKLRDSSELAWKPLFSYWEATGAPGNLMGATEFSQ